MRIGVISDTHITNETNKLENFLEKHFKGLDVIIHAGDYKGIRVVEKLTHWKHFYGVKGNVDGLSVQEFLDEKVIVETEGYRIGVFHGHGENKKTIERAYDQFKDQQVDIIIFGHSHQPIIRTVKGVLMVNPGSPNFKRKERWFSYIVLELNKEEIHVELKLFQNKLL